jgi:hypothetical protein
MFFNPCAAVLASGANSTPLGPAAVENALGVSRRGLYKVPGSLPALAVPLLQLAPERPEQPPSWLFQKPVVEITALLFPSA